MPELNIPGAGAESPVPHQVAPLEGWQIAQALESGMPSLDEWRERLSLERDEIIPIGRAAKLDFLKITHRLKDRPNGKYIDITAIDRKSTRLNSSHLGNS